MTITLTASMNVVPDTAAAKDTIAVLRADHDAVSRLFAAYEKSRSAPNKKALVAEICTALRVYAQVEEEIFYPELKDALKHKPLPQMALERASVNDLMAQLQGFEPDGEVYDAKVKVLGEYVEHHVRDMRNEMFNKATASSLDMIDLGARMSARKDDLLARAT